MRAALAREQRQLCCYCTGDISNGAFHIEHFRPRDGHETLIYIWRNLLASCQGGGTQNLVKGRRHCGAAKDNWFVEGATVDPTKAGVEALFHFPLSGKIFPAKTLLTNKYAEVESTINELHLNAPSLVARRQALLTKAGEDIRSLDPAVWRARYLEEHNGRYQEFWPALNYNYRKQWSLIAAY